MQKEIVVESVKSAPPVVITAAAIGGLTINEWVAVATIVYIILQAGYLVWKWYRESRKR